MTELPVTASSSGAKVITAIKNLRWYILAILLLSIALNYIDRNALSVLATTIQKDLGLSTSDYASINAWFLYAYGAMYLVGGGLIDLLGTRRGLGIFAVAWSAVAAVHALATNLWHLKIARLFLGITEAANIPAGVKAISEWFPVRERAFAIGIFNAGTAVGGAVAAFAVSFLALHYGWRAAFVLTGSLGFAWVVLWFLFYHAPAAHPRISQEERALIASGSASSQAAAAEPKVSLGKLLRMRETWGCVMSRICTDPISYFINIWIFKFFEEERGFTKAEILKFSWLPFVALGLGNLMSGAVPRALMARGWGLNKARKTVIGSVSLAMLFLWVGVTQVHSQAAAVGLVALITFGHGAWGNVTLPAEVFPKRVVGTISGLGGCLGTLTGAWTQIQIGKVVQSTGYKPLFLVCSAMYLIAFGFVALLIKDIGRVREIA